MFCTLKSKIFSRRISATDQLELEVVTAVGIRREYIFD